MTDILPDFTAPLGVTPVTITVTKSDGAGGGKKADRIPTWLLGFVGVFLTIAMVAIALIGAVLNP